MLPPTIIASLERAIERCKKAFGEGFTEGFAQGLAEGKKLESTRPKITEIVEQQTIQVSNEWNWYYCRRCRRMSKKICFCSCHQEPGDLICINLEKLIWNEAKK